MFCDSIYPLTKFKEIFGYPVLDGSTAESQRKRVLAEFRQSTTQNIVFLSKIGDTSIDLPEATVLIQVKVREGRRRSDWVAFCDRRWDCVRAPRRSSTRL